MVQRLRATLNDGWEARQSPATDVAHAIAGLLRVRPVCGDVGRQRRVYSEFAGRRGVEATRYGDWEYGGRCTDF